MRTFEGIRVIDFTQAIAGEAPYPLPASEAIHGIEVFDAIMKSAEAGTTEKVG